MIREHDLVNCIDCFYRLSVLVIHVRQDLFDQVLKLSFRFHIFSPVITKIQLSCFRANPDPLCLHADIFLQKQIFCRKFQAGVYL